jgi:hypothetical protein
MTHLFRSYLSWDILATVLILGACVVFRPPDVTGQGKTSLAIQTERKAEVMGYVRGLYEQGGHTYISLDEVEWLTDADAKTAMREDGWCACCDACEPPNPFYIRNRDEQTINYRVLNESVILMQTMSHGPQGDFVWDARISLDRFRQIFEGDAHPHLKSVPYVVTVDRGVVTAIREQYVP